MGDMEVPTFASSEEEASFWKEEALKYKGSLEETKEEFEEFQENSRELEAELETQMEQLEHKNKELRALVNRLQFDNDSLKERLESVLGESHREVTELQNELAQIKCIKDGLMKYVRELEQANDDLERAKRATVNSLEDFEGQLNSAIERNAFLESELDEKEQLKEMVHRLKDESRDLRYELQIKGREECGDGGSEPDNDKLAEKQSGMITDNYKYTAETETQTQPGSPIKGGSGQLLTPSARISALNIVGDLLRKVGALESKLASCRTGVKDGTLPPEASRSSKRLPRGTSSPNVQGLIRA